MLNVRNAGEIQIKVKLLNFDPVQHHHVGGGKICALMARNGEGLRMVR